MTFYARDGDWWSSGVWLALFKRTLGVTHKQAHSMLNILIKKRVLIKYQDRSLYMLAREKAQ